MKRVCRTVGAASLACLALVGCERIGIRFDERRGDQIVDAIDRFHNATGHYPQALSDLVPRYLRAIPQPQFGKRTWTYVLDGDQFVVAMCGPLIHDTCYGWRNDKRRWIRDDMRF